jgi:hypothetical protein
MIKGHCPTFTEDEPVETEEQRQGERDGRRNGARFKLFCIWCKKHCPFGTCAHNMENIRESIECAYFEDAGRLVM